MPKSEIGRWANNRVENSHLPFRPYKSSLRSMPTSTTTSTRNATSSIAKTYKERRSAALDEWQSLMG